MRVAAITLGLVLLASMGAAASGGTTYASSTYECQVLFFVPIQPPAACPEVDQRGTVTPLACADDACTVKVQVLAHARGAPVGNRAINAETQVADASQLAAPICAFSSTLADVACSGEATLTLVVPGGECTDFRVRSTLSDLGAGGLWGFRLVTDYGFRLCHDAGNQSHVERS